MAPGAGHIAGSFELDLTNFALDTAEKIDQVFRSVCLGVSTKIITRTPVDTGRARANWQPGISSAPNAALVATDKSGGATIAKVENSVGQLRGRGLVDLEFFLANNLPYIEVLEYGREDGSPGSYQAPQGMVRITLTEFPGIVSRAIAGAK